MRHMPDDITSTAAGLAPVSDPADATAPPPRASAWARSGMWFLLVGGAAALRPTLGVVLVLNTALALLGRWRRQQRPVQGPMLEGGMA